MVVTAYQSASGVVNLVTPTSAVVMGGLALAKVCYDQWLRFTLPLIIRLLVMCAAIGSRIWLAGREGIIRAGGCMPGGPGSGSGLAGRAVCTRAVRRTGSRA